MRLPRVTIACGMTVIAVVAVNAALVRALVVNEMFMGAVPIFMALQFGLWRLLRSRGRTRQFWVGFEVAGAASVLALFVCKLLPNSAPSRLLSAYVTACFNISQRHLPTSVDDAVMENQFAFLVLLYFQLELALAALGGLIAARLPRPRLDPRLRGPGARY